jgi:Holliday junction resolvase
MEQLRVLKMVNPRAKGQRGEYGVRDMLRTASGLGFERVPASGALAYLKGDLYIPQVPNRFCIEVKNYKESHINDKILTSKTNKIVEWWNKIEEQAIDSDMEPLLFVKYDRSKVFVVTNLKPAKAKNYLYISFLRCYIIIAEEWLGKETIKWLK